MLDAWAFDSRIHEIGADRVIKEAADEIEKLRAALQSVLDACDQGWKVERSVGGMTVEGQMRRSFYNRVPAWLIEEARAALGEKA
jgi:hypothetical protein